MDFFMKVVDERLAAVPGPVHSLSDRVSAPERDLDAAPRRDCRR